MEHENDDAPFVNLGHLPDFPVFFFFFFAQIVLMEQVFV